jgi:hypothetical protein
LTVTCLSIKDAIIVFQAKVVLLQNVPSYCGDIYDHPHSILHISYKNTVFMAVACSYDCNFPGLPSLYCRLVSCRSGGTFGENHSIMIMRLVDWRRDFLLRVDFRLY